MIFAVSVLPAAIASASSFSDSGRESPSFVQSPGKHLPSAVLPERARISERIFGLPGLSNVGRVAPGIYRGAQPDNEGYLTL